MPSTNTIDGDLRVTGRLVPATFTPPAGAVDNAAVAASAGIVATKLQHQYIVTHTQKTGADVATQTEDVHIVHGLTGTVVGVDVACSTAPTGGDKAFTVNVHKGNQSTAFATILTGNISYSSSQANRQVVSGTLVGSPTLADGDTLRVIVTTSGSTGSQGQGLVVAITLREDAD